MALHHILEQLHAALTAWEAAVKARTSLTGYFDPHAEGGCRREEQAVELASVAFEDFRAGLGQQGIMKRLGMSDSQDSKAARAHELLQALSGYSPWSAVKVQELLRWRASYLADATWDPKSTRFPSAEQFLQLVSDRRRWPEAEALALRWPEILDRTLGRVGAEDWRRRAQQQRVARAKARQKLAEEGEPCGFMQDAVDQCLGMPRKGPKVDGFGDGHVTGHLTFTRIRAQNLRSADLLDESDPFVKFELGLLPPAQTSVVWNNEKNPEWKDPETGLWEEVLLHVSRLPLSDLPQLRVSLWDKDHFSRSDSLGSQTLPVFDLLKEQGGGRSLGQKVTFSPGALKLQGPGAGDRGASVDFDVTWTPGRPGEGLGERQDPLVLQPEDKDQTLQLVAEMEAELPRFLQEFGPESAESLGFFLQPQDSNADIGAKAQGRDMHYGESDMRQVQGYNDLLNKIKNRLQENNLDAEELGDLLRKVRDVERGAGRSRRHMFAFQDECMPVIGEWSTDRRRQLRNQVFLAKLASGVDVIDSTWASCLLPVFVLFAVLFGTFNMLALSQFRDEDGRGWIIIVSSLAGFICVAAAITVSLPIWKPYFDKPRSGANSYQYIQASG